LEGAEEVDLGGVGVLWGCEGDERFEEFPELDGEFVACSEEMGAVFWTY